MTQTMRTYREAKRDFEAIEPVVDVTIWHAPVATRDRDGRKTVRRGAEARIVVEAHDVNDSECLTGVMKDHELVITDFALGKTGFRASLRYAAEVY